MRRRWAVVGLGFGDEGKGSVVDALVRRVGADLVVRFNGGPQAGHNVVLPDGRHHCFRQFGSGTLAGARTHLASPTVVCPFLLQDEARTLHNLIGYRPWPSLTVSPGCVVTTPLHRAANRLREAARGAARHGSCGMGVGEARTMDIGDEHLLTLRAGGLHNTGWTARVLRIQQEMYNSEFGLSGDDDTSPDLNVRVLRAANGPNIWAQYYEAIARHFRLLDDDELGDDARVVFEGAQGVLLDETFGFHPHTTWSDCTFDAAERVSAAFASDDEPITRVGVLRTYHTRHGAGPFPTEREDMPLPPSLEHNGTNEFQGKFRVGDFDAVLARYAVEVVGGVHALAVTHATGIGLPAVCGYVTKGGAVVTALRAPTRGEATLTRQEDVGRMLAGARPQGARTRELTWGGEIGALLDTPVGLVSYGPTYEDKRFLGEWWA